MSERGVVVSGKPVSRDEGSADRWNACQLESASRGHGCWSHLNWICPVWLCEQSSLLFWLAHVITFIFKTFCLSFTLCSTICRTLTSSLWFVLILISNIVNVRKTLVYLCPTTTSSLEQRDDVHLSRLIHVRDAHVTSTMF